ncbi:Zn-dependent hydrolase [Lysinibacillus piscis]|uniref:Zn-dependent hydrolase n=1 Tax=Lysinibacillus piscis TaxID=2518931 RepID=A0ABQ5NNH0_9BACI|nr:Zn-dependent hydrolase [Lysinibacillus sp. KH24]GLC89895.1 Zn-dependent hydrolase [Lysinibacillus sp. KH24]
MINDHRLLQHLEQLSQIGCNDITGGINRLSFTLEEQQAIELVASYMQDAGMTVSVDAIGNIIGTYGTGPETVMLGSHIDTVPEGGKYDGALGVLAAIEVVHTLHEQHIRPTKKIQVVAFKDEEGTRFGFGLIGSKAMAGLLTDEQLQQTDAQGISIAEAMTQFGLDAQTVTLAKRHDITAYLEMHIEQGKVLENENLPVGIVTGIAAPLWLEITVTGISEHAGATPMPIRQDALTAASEMVLAIEQLANDGSDSVATVGKLHVEPNGVNVVPGKVVFTVDIRDIEQDKITALENQILHKLADIAQRRHVQLQYKILQRVQPAKTDTILQQQLAARIEQQGIRPYFLMSGAGHDAMNIALVAPIAMLFVRSKDGISHNPLEYTSDEDIIVATKIFYDTVLTLIK